MNGTAEVIESLLDAADQQAREIMRDDKYSDAFKIQQAEEIKARARRQAVQASERALREAQDAVERARVDVVEREREHRDQLDYNRLVAEQKRIEAAVSQAVTWDEVEALAETDDEYRLDALASVGVAALAKKVKSAPVGPFRDKGGDVEVLRQRVVAKQRLYEPEMLKAAREEYDAAREEYDDLKVALQSVNWRRAQRTGGAGPLADALAGPRETVVEHKKDGKLIFTTKGRWI